MRVSNSNLPNVSFPRVVVVVCSTPKFLIYNWRKTGWRQEKVLVVRWAAFRGIDIRRARSSTALSLLHDAIISVRQAYWNSGEIRRILKQFIIFLFHRFHCYTAGTRIIRNVASTFVGGQASKRAKSAARQAQMSFICWSRSGHGRSRGIFAFQ